jgi:hypothetical protein
VFEAFLETEKWFQVSYGEERLKQVVNDRRVGGQIYEDWGGGTGKLYGTIGWWDPPAGFSQTSQMLGGGITLTHRYEFADEPEGRCYATSSALSARSRTRWPRESSGTARSRPSSSSSAPRSSAAR